MKVANSAGEDEAFWGTGEQCLLGSVNGHTTRLRYCKVTDARGCRDGSRLTSAVLLLPRTGVRFPGPDSSQPPVPLCSVVPGNLGIWNLWPWGCNHTQTPTLRHIIKLIKNKPSWTVGDSWLEAVPSFLPAMPSPLWWAIAPQTISQDKFSFKLKRGKNSWNGRFCFDYLVTIKILKICFIPTPSLE